MGPGGEYLANELAKAGLAVAGVEDRLVGGECPYWGCVPSKMMIRAANLLAEGRRIPVMAGWPGISPPRSPPPGRVKAAAHDSSRHEAPHAPGPPPGEPPSAGPRPPTAACSSH